MSRFLILSRPKSSTSWKALSHIMEGGVGNDDDEMSQEIEVSHSICTAYVSGVVDGRR